MSGLLLRRGAGCFTWKPRKDLSIGVGRTTARGAAAGEGLTSPGSWSEVLEGSTAAAACWAALGGGEETVSRQIIFSANAFFFLQCEGEVARHGCSSLNIAGVLAKPGGEAWGGSRAGRAFPALPQSFYISYSLFHPFEP